jgi:hypothetical protein
MVGDNLTSESVPNGGSEGWRAFWGRHRSAVLLFAIAVALVVLDAIMVFLWYVGQAQLNGTVPLTLGLWTMSALVSFLLNLLFWEFVLVGIPAIVAAIAAWSWYRRLPEEERREYRFFRKRSRRRNGGGAFSLIVFIVFCLKVYLDGNWHTPFAGWTFDYLVYSYITAIVWILLIAAIPAAIGLIWWIGYGSKKR